MQIEHRHMHNLLIRCINTDEINLPREFHMSIKIVVSFDVADVDSFLAGFATGVHARNESGITAEAFANIDDPNNIVVIGTAPSKEAFTKFFATSAAQDRMKNAGVSSPPNITFLESR